MLDWLRRLIGATTTPARTLPSVDPSLFDGPAPVLYGAIAHRFADAPHTGPADGARDKIAELEQRYAVRLPDDFRDYLLCAAPVSETMDDIGIYWWEIDRVRNIPDEVGAGWADHDFGEINAERQQYLVFADFLVWCYAWAICCSDGPNRGRVILLGGSPDKFVANSFREFVTMALTDSPVIHG